MRKTETSLNEFLRDLSGIKFSHATADKNALITVDPRFGQIDFSSNKTEAELRQQRIDIYFRLIQLQGALLDAGITRISVLRDQFAFYTWHILGGVKSSALQDLYQQELDAAVCASLSDSFAQHACNVSGGRGNVSLQLARKKANGQFDTYKNFLRDRDNDDAAAIKIAENHFDFTAQEIEDGAGALEGVTRTVANLNWQLAKINFELFQNAVALHKITEGQSAKADKFESDGIFLAWQRAQRYAIRAAYLDELADKVSPYQGGAQAEVSALPSVQQGKLLYLAP